MLADDWTLGYYILSPMRHQPRGLLTYRHWSHLAMFPTEMEVTIFTRPAKTYKTFYMSSNFDSVAL